MSGLVIMRAQPFHFGHARLIDKALADHDDVFVMLGSMQERGTSRNPFTFSERKEMIKSYYLAHEKWEQLIVMGLIDIYDPVRWADYTLTEISNHFPDTVIEHLYCGSEYDFSWFRQTKVKPVIVDRVDQKHPFITASMLREMLVYGDARWKQYIPECNWPLVAKKFNRLDML